MNKHERTKRFLIILTLICGLPILIFAQQETTLSTEENVKQDLQLNVCENAERLEAVKKLFKNLGAADDEIKIEKFKNVENIVVTKKGKSDEIIVIGAHYDKTSDGCGAIDNWTGIVIIANLYKTLKKFTTEKTYLFVAFGQEEVGLIGSGQMAKAISKKEREKYCSMINFDSFGFGYPQVLENVSNSKMTETAKEVGERAKISVKTASLKGAADADSTSFLKNDIPAITFHGLSNKWQEYLHGPKDKLENVNVQSVYVGYRFGFDFLAEIDQRACDVFKK